MNYKAMHDIELMARKRFTYRPDPGKLDRWFSYHDYVLRGELWADDCDSLASTVINLMVKWGLPLDKAWFAHVDSDFDRTLDHMIAFAEDDEGKLWVVGDTFGAVYPASQMKHKLKTFCKVSNIMEWFAGDNVEQLRLI